MSQSIDNVINYQPTYFKAYAQLDAEAKKIEPLRCFTSAYSLEERLYRPNHSPEQNLFLVGTAGNIVGYVDVTLELNIERAILNCFVHPDHRRKGLATKLLSYATDRAKQLGAKAVHVNISKENADAKIVLAKLGFEFVRRFLQLRLDMVRVLPQDTHQAVPQYRNIQRGDEYELAQIQNRSFAGSWGYNPNTVEELVYELNLSSCSTEDIKLAYEGDKVIGYCWTRTICEIGRNERIGQIFMLGVDPAYRGKGIGKGVLFTGLSYLKSKGRRVTELTVDSENKIACNLYKSAGFEFHNSNLWYEKKIV